MSICPNCGRENADGNRFCEGCGSDLGMMKGGPIPNVTNNADTVSGGYSYQSGGYQYSGNSQNVYGSVPPVKNYNSTPVQSTKSKIAAGIFGIMWGAFGVHKFYLGYAAEGGIMLGVWLACFVLCFLTFGLTSLGCFAVQIIGLIEGIMYMTKSDEEFYQTYIVNKKGWF